MSNHLAASVEIRLGSTLSMNHHYVRHWCSEKLGAEDGIVFEPQLSDCERCVTLRDAVLVKLKELKEKL